jgi:membrane protein required for beta-lactamase induction
MPTQALFGISVAFGFVAWGIVAAQYFWPALRAQSRVDALRPLLILHSFRFVGLSFLIPGVVAPELPSAFAVPAAYGDLIAALLALLALAALRSSIAIPFGMGIQSLG